MVELINKGVYLLKNGEIVTENRIGDIEDFKSKISSDLELEKNSGRFVEEGKKKTMTYKILENHNYNKNTDELKIKFDALASHDITYVGIIQTAKASGLKRFPLPYVLTNCHNSLCAVGGTINEDDHLFGLTAAKKFGGIYVPAHQAVIHQYMREMMTECGSMILGSDSHTRYGALGTMGFGEGGPELVKQLLEKTYDIEYPKTCAVYLKGKPKDSVGPQDIALSIIGNVFKNSFVKNHVLEFIGPGINNLSVDFRNGIDVMTTETTCLSSIWTTDDKVEDYYKSHGREKSFKKLSPEARAYYDKAVVVDLDKIEPMIALPFHPSNTYTIKEFKENPKEILAKVEENAKNIFENKNLKFNLQDKVVNGKVMVDQGVIAGCAGGTYENIKFAEKILKNKTIGDEEFSLNVYPASQPINFALTKDGTMSSLMEVGGNIKTAFCGPCFGAGDVPSNDGFSIRHTTRNFPNREGSKPSDDQISYVALMDAKSIAATAANGGCLTGADEIEFGTKYKKYEFNNKIYKNRVYNGYKKEDKKVELKYGPNIKDWPEMITMPEHLLLEVAAAIYDDVTTTDELIPSGDTSSYRSNPLKLAEFALSRKDRNYVDRAKKVQAVEKQRIKNENFKEVESVFEEVLNRKDKNLIENTSLGTVIYANKPGDGSAREQAASVQKVLGGWGNIAKEYATKRYRSNCINWGLIPFEIDGDIDIKIGDWIFVENIHSNLKEGKDTFEAKKIRKENVEEITLKLPNMTKDEREILIEGSLINYYKSNK